MSKWQPIETAPKDGAQVLVAHLFEDGEALMSVASWWIKDWAALGSTRVVLGNGMSLPMVPLDYEPTHWMPLPAPPEGLE